MINSTNRKTGNPTAGPFDPVAWSLVRRVLVSRPVRGGDGDGDRRRVPAPWFTNRRRPAHGPVDTPRIFRSHGCRPCRHGSGRGRRRPPRSGRIDFCLAPPAAAHRVGGAVPVVAARGCRSPRAQCTPSAGAAGFSAVRPGHTGRRRGCGGGELLLSPTVGRSVWSARPTNGRNVAAAASSVPAPAAGNSNGRARPRRTSYTMYPSTGGRGRSRESRGPEAATTDGRPFKRVSM